MSTLSISLITDPIMKESEARLIPSYENHTKAIQEYDSHTALEIQDSFSPNSVLLTANRVV